MPELQNGAGNTQARKGGGAMIHQKLRAIHRREQARARFTISVERASLSIHPTTYRLRSEEARRHWRWVLRWDEAVNSRSEDGDGKRSNRRTR